jgi:UDP-N-acetyl-D-mannosaminuronic acid transferase (WecB/TagA/CpsF family)
MKINLLNSVLDISFKKRDKEVKEIIKCRYCDKKATQKVVWLKNKYGEPATIRVNHCGCDLMKALTKIYGNPYPIEKDVDYRIEAL